MKVLLFKSVFSIALLTLLMVVAFVDPSNVYADVNHCGSLSGNETWAASDNVHIVTCDVTIPAGVTLTIEAGAIVKFQIDAQINVNGKLVAQGISGNPIYFTSYLDDDIGGDTNGDGLASALAEGDWGGIRFNAGSDDSSIITRAVIRYSGSDSGTAFDDGAIRLDNASRIISYTKIVNNNYRGIEALNDSTPTLDWQRHLQ